jgi:hypothetical protein
VLIQPGQLFPALEGLLHPPSGTCDLDQGGQGCRRGGVTAVVGKFAGGAVAADQQLVAARCRFGEGDDSPVVESLSLRAASGRELLLRRGPPRGHALGRTPLTQGSEQPGGEQSSADEAA